VGLVIAEIGEVKEKAAAEAAAAGGAGEKMDEAEPEDEKACKICFVNPIDSVLLNCGTSPVRVRVRRCVSCMRSKALTPPAPGFLHRSPVLLHGVRRGAGPVSHLPLAHRQDRPHLPLVRPK
jgi:hypothetical protein